MTTDLKILFPVDEAYPLYKIGGLGDVGGSLPKALTQLGIDVRLALPKHPQIQLDETFSRLCEFTVEYNSQQLPVIVWLGILPGSQVPVYLFEEQIYLSEHTDASDNHANKFAVFSLVVATWVSYHSANWQPQLIHFHDWHTALIPIILKYKLNVTRYKTVGTIHNLVYQGQTDTPVLNYLGIDPHQPGLLTKQYPQGIHMSILLEGLTHSDWIVAVSPTYAQEILTQEYGAGINNELKLSKEKISGIINGIDTDVFNPAIDSTIATNYTVESANQGKETNKRALLTQIGLTNEIDTLIGFVGRVDPGQKGVQLIIELLNRQLLPDVDRVGLVFLGTGDPKLEEQLHEASRKYPSRVRIFTKYDELLASQIYAASDVMIIPSRYEPCGLVQMIAMRYGALPLARSTGGLKDTIIHNQDGFLFTEYTLEAFVDCLKQALVTLVDTQQKDRMIRNAMIKDFSWTKSANEYHLLYKKLVNNSH